MRPIVHKIAINFNQIYIKYYCLNSTDKGGHIKILPVFWKLASVYFLQFYLKNQFSAYKILSVSLEISQQVFSTVCSWDSIQCTHSVFSISISFSFSFCFHFSFFFPEHTSALFPFFQNTQTHSLFYFLILLNLFVLFDLFIVVYTYFEFEPATKIRLPDKPRCLHTIPWRNRDFPQILTVIDTSKFD